MRRVHTAEERDELVAHLEREQDLTVVALAAAQHQVETLRDVYRRNREAIERLHREPVFENRSEKRVVELRAEKRDNPGRSGVRIR